MNDCAVLAYENRCPRERRRRPRRHFAWIIKDNPRAASAIVRRIRRRIGQLATPGLEHMGRPGLEPGTRELVEPPYIIVYEVHETRGEIEVLQIVHGAQDCENRD